MKKTIRMKTLRWLLACSFFTALGCGASHQSRDPDASDSGVLSPDSERPMPDATMPDGGARLEACFELCQLRREGSISGGCPFDMFPETGSCEEHCSEIQAFSDDAREAFEGCVAEDPLCFQTIDSCLYQRLYPGGTVVPVLVTGMGLSTVEGSTVVLGVGELPDVRGETVVSGGRFEVRLEALVSGFPPAVFGYFDLNEDGRCTPDVDATFYETPTRTRDFDAPSLLVTLDGLPDAPGTVCTSF